MLIHLTTKDASPTQFAHLSSRTRPDKYVLQRVNGPGNRHRLTFTLDQFLREMRELDLRIAGSRHPIEITIELQDTDRNDGELLTLLRQDLVDALEREQALITHVSTLQEAIKAGSTEAPPAAPDPKHLAALEERDAMMEVLRPLAIEGETGPLQVLQRLTSTPDAPPPSPSTEGDEYDHDEDAKDHDHDDETETEHGDETDETERTAGDGDPVTGDKSAIPAVDHDAAQFDEERFRDRLPKKANKLKPMAAALGVPGYEQMNAGALTEAIVAAEIAKGSKEPPAEDPQTPGMA